MARWPWVGHAGVTGAPWARLAVTGHRTGVSRSGVAQYGVTAARSWRDDAARHPPGRGARHHADRGATRAWAEPGTARRSPLRVGRHADDHAQRDLPLGAR